jgi:SAM-dependent methyltransferase
MSFWPLARRITEELQVAQARGPLLEIGAGDGSFSARLSSLGLSLHLLDRAYPPAPAGFSALAADATQLPFKDKSLQAVVMANLLRQLRVREARQTLREVQRCLVEGGRVLVLEDHPKGRGKAEKNYRCALTLLAEAQVDRAAATVSPEQVRSLFRPSFGLPQWEAIEENEEEVRAPRAPLEWLFRSGHSPREVEALAHSVQEHGMRYGRYFCQIYRPASVG